MRHRSIRIPVPDAGIDGQPAEEQIDIECRFESGAPRDGVAARRVKRIDGFLHVAEVGGPFVRLLDKAFLDEARPVRARALGLVQVSSSSAELCVQHRAVGGVFDHRIQAPVRGSLSGVDDDAVERGARSRHASISKDLGREDFANLSVVAEVRGKRQLLESVEALVAYLRELRFIAIEVESKRDLSVAAHVRRHERRIPLESHAHMSPDASVVIDGHRHVDRIARRETRWAASLPAASPRRTKAAATTWRATTARRADGHDSLEVRLHLPEALRRDGDVQLVDLVHREEPAIVGCCLPAMRRLDPASRPCGLCVQERRGCQRAPHSASKQTREEASLSSEQLLLSHDASLAESLRVTQSSHR